MKTAVTWYLKNPGGNTEKILYSVVSGEHSSHRHGLQMNESKLKRGNAELFLPQIQLSEEGTYVCSVTVTPDKAEGTKIIDIVAQPTVILSPRKVTTERDREKTLSCAVHKFYPGLIEIRWQKDSKQTPDKCVPAEDICTGSSVENGDGTFNVTTKLSLQPSLQDNGNIYSCIVDHKSFPTKQIFSATLTVTDPPQNLSWLAGLFAVMIVACAAAAFVYYWWFMKIQPTVLAFIGNTELKHMEVSELRCLISGFRPKPLDIAFFITKSNNEKQKIFSWNSKTSDVENRDEQHPLLTTGESIEVSATLKEEKRSTFQVSCKICIVPDVKHLDKYKLSLEVRHGALPHGFLVETASFKVTAPPLLDPVWCSTDMPRSEEIMTLNCKIHSYFPQTIDVHWSADDEQLPEEPFLSEPMRATDGLFFCTSSIKYLPKAADSGKRFLCKAKLTGSQHCKESVWTMKTVVCTPKVSQIDCEPRVPECGRAITLSCSMKDFSPSECDICWRRGFEKLTHAQISTEEPYLDTTSNLYCMKSQASFTPKPEDHGVEFVVEINHCNKTTRHTYILTLKGFPKISDILVDPSDAEYGIPLSLTCRVLDFYPKDINIQWFHAKPPVVSEIKAILEDSGKVSHEISVTDFAPCHLRVVWYKDWKKISEVSDPSDIRIEENKLCSFTSKIQVNRKEADTGKMIRCEVYHPQTNSYQEKSFVLESKDFSSTLEQIPTYPKYLNSKIPRVQNTSEIPCVQNHTGTSRSYGVTSEEVHNPLKIECITSSPKSGENVRLRCMVHGKRADDAYVSWYKGLFPVDEGIENVSCSDGSGFISYVTFKTEEEEQTCEIRCEVSVDAEHWEEICVLELGKCNITTR
ncbi:UNVERIFIED_CONTAM: hypothetical protein K2H54_059866 [Gekko kuhli]